MDRSYEIANNFTLQQLKERILIKSVDDTALGTGVITDITGPVKLILENGYEETLRFLIIDCPRYNAILGLKWLTTRNPIIDWKLGTMRLINGTKAVVEVDDAEITMASNYQNLTKTLYLPFVPLKSD